MPRTYDTLTLQDAKRMLSAAEAKAADLGMAYNIAVVDAGGNLLAFVHQLAGLAQPGKPLFGIQESNAGKVVVFGGGVPIKLNGNVVGAVGASAGTVEQDIAVCTAAIAALDGS